jgi:hypothetical protein
MPITYSTDTSGNLITEVWTGEVTAECLEAHWKKYLADPEVLATRRTLVDLRNAQILFNGSELSALVKNIVEPLLNGKDWKTAIVVERAVQYGVSRQYQVFADRYSEDAIFYDFQKAHAWLTSLPY